MIKEREPFRPFAPAILSERTAEYFAAEADDRSPTAITCFGGWGVCDCIDIMPP